MVQAPCRREDLPSHCLDMVGDVLTRVDSNDSRQTAAHELAGAASPNPRIDVIEPLALSPAQAARALSLSRPSLYGLLNSGQLRSVRVGSRRLIPVAPLPGAPQRGQMASSETTPARAANPSRALTKARWPSCPARKSTNSAPSSVAGGASCRHRRLLGGQATGTPSTAARRTPAAGAGGRHDA